MRLHVIGTGSPDPRGERFGSCFVLEVGDEWLMVDCGPASTYKLARMGIPPARITALFFTHHHFDHNADYPCFMLCRWDQDTGKQPPIKVYGPPPTQEFTRRLFGQGGAFEDDIRARIGHPASQAVHKARGGSLPRPAPLFDVKDIGPDAVVEGQGWRVTAAGVRHVEPWLQSLIYRVDSPSGSVVFTGDAGPCPALYDISRGADALVICAAYGGRAQPDIAACVTGPEDAARIASQNGMKTVVLTHASPGMSQPGRMEATVAQVAGAFAGRIIFANELTTLVLP